MNFAPCRQCSAEVAAAEVQCPECGAPHPADPDWNGAGYEWKSGTTVRGWPLVHVAFGCDATGRVRVARGVVAIGARAVGGLACGIMAAGGLAIGIVSAGIFSLGVVSFAAAVAIGVNAIGPLAIGVVAVGAVGGGVQFIGWKMLFSLMPPRG